MITSPLFLFFTHEYVTAMTFAGQNNALQNLSVDEFKTQIPLFFEIKSSSHIYPIRKFIYDNPQGRVIYGHIFRAVDNNEEYKLHGKSFPIINILSDILQVICEKYRNTQENITTEAIDTVLVLPFDLSDKSKERLVKFLKENCGLRIIATKNLPEIILPKQQLFLQSLGEQRIWFLNYEANSEIIEPKKLEINEKAAMHKIAELVVQRARKNSSTNVDDSEIEKEIKKSEIEMPFWIAETKQKGTHSITINFKDGYAGLDLLSREDIDKIFLDNTLILSRVAQLDKIHSFAKIVLVGQNVNNLVLHTLLKNEFGGARVSIKSDDEIVTEAFFQEFEQWQTTQLQQLLQQLKTKITNLIRQQNGELTSQQQQEILLQAQQFKLNVTEIQDFITTECDKIVFLDFEQIGETPTTLLLKVKHRKLGTVAMKSLKEKFSQHADSKNKLQIEFGWLKKMENLHIAKVIEQSAATENVVYYLSEWLGGVAMAQTALPINNHTQIQQYALQILEALQVLHTNHWYHSRLNDKHIFVENIGNQSVIKLTNSKIEYAGASQIEAKQQQNIKEVGLLLLQWLTGKNHAQAISQLNEGDNFQYQWKNIIQRSSGGSSGNPYRNVGEMRQAIAALDFTPPKAPPIKIPWKKIAIGVATVLVLFVGYKFGSAAISSVKEKFASTDNSQQCQPFKQLFMGTLVQADSQKLIVALQVISTQPKDKDICTLQYTLRMDTPDKKPYYERGKTAEVFIGQKKIRFDGALGNVTYSWVNGKMVLKSENFEKLELK